MLDSPGDDTLRRDALDTLCAVAVILGPDFAIFVPTVRKVRHTRYDIMLLWRERWLPPCFGRSQNALLPGTPCAS